MVCIDVPGDILSLYLVEEVFPALPLCPFVAPFRVLFAADLLSSRTSFPPSADPAEHLSLVSNVLVPPSLWPGVDGDHLDMLVEDAR